MGHYVIERREIREGGMQTSWRALDPECKFSDLELAFRVAKIIQDARNHEVEYRICRLDHNGLTVIPSL